MAQTSPREREGYVSTPDGRLWYRVAGSGGRTPLLIVHGGPGSNHDYLEPLEALSDERPVIFYDQLGCGRSDRPEDPALWRVERFVAEVDRVREALDLSRVHLFGHSWGSMVAVDYALTRPSGLASLVLASPFASVPRFLEGIAGLRAALPKETQEVLRRHEAAGTTQSREFRRAAMVFYRRHLCRMDPWPEILVRSNRAANSSMYNLMWGPAEFFPTGSLMGFDLTDRLHEITVPTLLNGGRYDEVLPEHVALYQSLLPRSEFVIFEESAHMPHLEEPDRYLQALRDFLRRAEKT